MSGVIVAGASAAVLVTGTTTARKVADSRIRTYLPANGTGVFTPE
jgi:hypothetical protein